MEKLNCDSGKKPYKIPITKDEIKKKVKELLSEMPHIPLNGKARISDISVAATLIYLKYKLIGIDKISECPRCFYFIIDISEKDLQEKSDKMCKNKIKVLPQRFYQIIKSLINDIYLLAPETTNRYMSKYDTI